MTPAPEACPACKKPVRYWAINYLFTVPKMTSEWMCPHCAYRIPRELAE